MNARCAKLLRSLRNSGLSTAKEAVLLRVEWDDAETANGWRSLDEPPATHLSVVSVGYYVGTGPIAICLASSISNEHPTTCANQFIRIPKAWITKVEIIRRDKLPHPSRPEGT